MREVIWEKLTADVRFQEGFTACMNCGVCTAICPAAEFYKYDPRVICTIVQSGDVDEIEKLLKGDEIWYCGQCMSCKPRCPRGNTVGMIITVLRKISQELGYFVESEKGRQQLAIERAIGQSIINQGYCVHPDIATYENHPEQGPVWKWYLDNIEELSTKMGAIYKKRGAGALRDVGQENLEEIRKIFEVTGGMAFYEQIEAASQNAADALNVDFGDDYFTKVYTENSGNHNR